MLLTANKRRLQSQPRPIDEVIRLIDAGSHNGLLPSISAASAMRQSTVWACVRILSEIIAQLPIEVHRRQNGAWVESIDHQIVGLLAEPNAWQTQHDLISHLVSWSELAGNGCLFKKTDTRGRVRGLLPLETTDINAEMTPDWRLIYSLASDKGIGGIYTSERIFHYRNFSSDGYWGLSTIGNHKQGIGLAIQLETHAVNAYKNGLQTSRWVELESPLDAEEKKEFKKELKALQGAQNAGETPVFHGAKLHDIGAMNATDAQYIESRRMQKQEIAAIFGVPLFLLNDTEKSTTWGTGLEQLSRSFVRFSLNPRLNRLAQTLIRELVPAAERASTKIIFDTDQFTLGEFKDRMEGYKTGIEAGVLNPDEAREVEGRNPRPGGDQYRQPMNIGTEGQPNE